MTMLKVTNRDHRKARAIVLSTGEEKVIPARGSAMLPKEEIERDVHGQFRAFASVLHVESVPVVPPPSGGQDEVVPKASKKGAEVKSNG